MEPARSADADPSSALRDDNKGLWDDNAALRDDNKEEAGREEEEGVRASSQCATHSLAVSMNSSISRLDQPRSERVMADMLPSGSTLMTDSGRSKSMEPRRTRLRLSLSA